VEGAKCSLSRTSLQVRAAAGSLGEEMASAEEDWVPAPEGMRLSPDLFVAHVVGQSMEPRIPDGSLNLFRLHPAGSRQGKILLIERFGVLDETARYTIKKYTSRKVYRGEDEWQHEQVRLETLNPAFEAWDVDPEGFAVVAEWLRVIGGAARRRRLGTGARGRGKPPGSGPGLGPEKPAARLVRNGHRDLPWRRVSDPYRICVGIMLQQTRAPRR
jgi:hypothetical protein